MSAAGTPVIPSATSGGNSAARAASRSQTLSLSTSSGALVQLRTKSASYQPFSIITCVSERASAASVPGRTRSQWSALAARPALRGSTTISFAPRATAATVLVAGGDRRDGGFVAQDQNATGVVQTRQVAARHEGAEV